MCRGVVRDEEPLAGDGGDWSRGVRVPSGGCLDLKVLNWTGRESSLRWDGGRGLAPRTLELWLDLRD